MSAIEYTLITGLVLTFVVVVGLVLVEIMDLLEIIQREESDEL